MQVYRHDKEAQTLDLFTHTDVVDASLDRAFTQHSSVCLALKRLGRVHSALAHSRSRGTAP